MTWHMSYKDQSSNFNMHWSWKSQNNRAKEFERGISACALHPFLCCTKHKIDITIQFPGLFCPKIIYDMTPFEFTKQGLQNKRSRGPKCKVDTTSLIEGSICKTDLT